MLTYTNRDNPMNAIDFHDAIATQFDKKYAFSGAFGERFRVWTGLLDRYVDPTDCVMDIGCGSGIFSRYLADKGCTVTGIDGSVAMINLCNQRDSSVRLRYVIQSLPLSDMGAYGPQDVIVASSVLEYIGDMERMLHQIYAMLRPGGLLIVSMPNRLSVYRHLEYALFALTGRPRYFAHVRHVPTEANFSRQLTVMGFAVVETTYFSGYDPLSRLLKRVLPKRCVNNLFVGVYRKEVVGARLSEITSSLNAPKYTII